MITAFIPARSDRPVARAIAKLWSRGLHPVRVVGEIFRRPYGDRPRGVAVYAVECELRQLLLFENLPGGCSPSGAETEQLNKPRDMAESRASLRPINK